MPVSSVMRLGRLPECRSVSAASAMLRRGCRRRRQRLHALAVDERAVPELEIEQRPDRVAAVARARRDGRRAARSTAAALIRPRSRVRRSSSTSRATAFQWPRIQLRERHREAHLPARQDRARAARPRIASRRMRLVVKPRSFSRSGSRAANSTSM